MAAASGSIKKYLVPILGALVLILSAVLIYFQLTALQDLRSEVADEELALDLARANLTRLLSHRDNSREYERRLSYATRMIPPAAGEDEILRYIHNLAANAEMRAFEIRFGVRAEEETYMVMPLTITLEGSYTGLRQMLRQIYDGDRAFRVDNVSISRTGDASADLRINISAVTFYNR